MSLEGIPLLLLEIDIWSFVGGRGVLGSALALVDEVAELRDVNGGGCVAAMGDRGQDGIHRAVGLFKVSEYMVCEVCMVPYVELVHDIGADCREFKKEVAFGGEEQQTHFGIGIKIAHVRMKKPLKRHAEWI